MELDLQPGDVVKVLESAALGWVRARVIRVKSGGRVVVKATRVVNSLPEATSAFDRTCWFPSLTESTINMQQQLLVATIDGVGVNGIFIFLESNIVCMGSSFFS